MWPFECVGPNGQTYLHNDNWEKFVKERDQEYPHNWNHRRAILTLFCPRNTFRELPGVTEETALNAIEDNYSVIFQAYPAHLRTTYDPDANEESLNVFIEDGQSNFAGEKIFLFSSSYYFFPLACSFGFGERPERFAKFRDKYWRVHGVRGGGLGSAEPPPPPPKPDKKVCLRSLDDDWG